MSKFEKLEKIDKLVFLEEECPEKVKEEIIGKEQNAINDFIASLDEEVYENFSVFPLKLPMKLNYSDYIKLDDFIILSVKDEFYLFPKVFEKRLSDYIRFKTHFSGTPISQFDYRNKSNDKMNKIYTKYENWLCVVGLVWLSALLVAFVNLILFHLMLFLISLGAVCLLFPVLLFLEGKMTEIKTDINKAEKFTELLYKLKKLNFPLEFFENIDILDVLIYK